MNRQYLITVGGNRLRHRMRLRSSTLRRMRDAEEILLNHATRLVMSGPPRNAEEAEMLVASMVRKADEFCP